MIAAIEIGNSYITLGCIKNGSDPIGQEVFLRHIPTVTHYTDFEWLVCLRQIFEEENVRIPDVKGCVLSCVVPKVQPHFALALERLFSVKPLIVGPDSATNIEISLENPKELGSNLLSCAVAAVNRYGAPAIIINMGTAFSIGVIDENRRYLGGAILPGMQCAFRAFTDITKLPGFRITATDKQIGRNTEDALLCGSLYGNAGMIDGILDRMLSELSEDARENVTIISTGKQAEILAPYFKHTIINDPFLSHRGLFEIFQEKGGRS